MSVIRLKSGKGYRVKFMIGGQVYRHQPFATRAAAAEWEAEERKRIAAPPVPETHSASFLAVAKAYLAHCEARMCENTYRSKARYYNDFLTWAGGDMAMDAISPGMVNRYLIQCRQDHGAKRANRDLKDLKALWTWAIRQGEYHLMSNPCASIDPFPEEPSIKYVPPPEDIDAVLLAAGPEETDMLTVLYHTGGRIGEIRRLKWEDVNLEKRTVTLWTRKRRGGQLEGDPLAIGESLHGLLSRRWRERNKASVFVFCREDGSSHTKDGKLRHLMEDLCARAGVKPFGFHSIRHHVASILADSGKATLGQVQKFLRHKRPTTTERYLHEVTRDQREVAEILEEGRPESKERKEA